jgi:hypothetical protein
LIFCTLFNGRYLAQGIALYRSLEATARGRFVLYVLCMDDMTADALARLDLPHIRTIRLAEFETDALRAARANRSFGEYCWTCTAPLLMGVQELSGPDAVVAYVDADIRFFSNPQAIFDELGSRSIIVHEHDFSPAYRFFQTTAGRFNVGVVAVRNDAEGRACLDLWHRQGLAECVMDLAAGKCGDQTYLDEWPRLYPGLVISSNPGVGLAPWNIDKHVLGDADGCPTVDGRPAVFYHYHSLRVWRPRFGLRPVLMAHAPYAVRGRVLRAIYAPYIAQLKRAIRDVRAAGFAADAALDDVGIVRFLGNLALRRLNLSFDLPAGAAVNVGHGALQGAGE